MSEITELADRLGKMIAASPQAAKLRDARKELSQHPDVTEMLKDYQTQADKIGRLEQEQKPIEVDDKHKLQAAYEKLVANEIFKTFTAAQVDYVDLMRKVNGALQKALADVEGQ